MSLKSFHIFFIIIAMLLAGGCGAWGYFNQMSMGFTGACGILAGALFVYGIYFLRKSRNLIL